MEILEEEEWGGGVEREREECHYREEILKGGGGREREKGPYLPSLSPLFAILYSPFPAEMPDTQAMHLKTK